LKTKFLLLVWFIHPVNLFLTSITDPAASHLPDVNNIDGLMNLLSACVLVILGNVLDIRTYRAPTQEENQRANREQQILIDHEINTIPVGERFAICYSRGVALHLINWIRHFCVITGPGGENVRDLPSCFFVQIVQTLIKYKEGANTSQLELEANCTLDMLTRQIENIVDVDSYFSSLWLERHSLPSDSLALANQDEYSIQWRPDIRLDWSNLGQGIPQVLCMLCYNSQFVFQIFFTMVLLGLMNVSLMPRRIVNFWSCR
jgi:hypothetical protein